MIPRKYGCIVDILFVFAVVIVLIIRLVTGPVITNKDGSKSCNFYPQVSYVIEPDLKISCNQEYGKKFVRFVSKDGLIVGWVEPKVLSGFDIQIDFKFDLLDLYDHSVLKHMNSCYLDANQRIIILSPYIIKDVSTVRNIKITCSDADLKYTVQSFFEVRPQSTVLINLP